MDWLSMIVRCTTPDARASLTGDTPAPLMKFVILRTAQVNPVQLLLYACSPEV
jgi:hypothetical protein